MRAKHTPTGARMPRPTLDLVAALACGLAALVGPAPASAQPLAAALAGQVAPDTGDGTYASFGFVDVDRVGEVVFSAAVSGGTAPGGLFTVSQSQIQGSRAIALVGDVAPGEPYPFPVTFAEFQGATIAGRKVAFLATFDVLGQTGGGGIYLADVESGAITLLAKVGGPSPAGGVFQLLRVPSNHCGDVVFAATAGPSESVLTCGIFRSAGGILSAVVLQGDPAPGLGDGTFQSFGDPNCMASFPENRVGFSADVAFLALPPLSGVFRYAGGTGELVAAQDELSTDGVPYGAFSPESPGASSAIGPRLGYTDGAGLFLFPRVGSSTAVTMARLGQAAPRTGGGTFAAFPGSPVLMSTDNGTSLLAFAEVSGGSAPSGVFRMFHYGFGLSVSAPAIVGDPAPGTGGGTYSAFSRPAAADANNPYIGDSGVIAFAAEVSGGTASSGVFVLPEPGALVARLAGAALLALLSTGRRRSRA